jgi:hypothetical protein
MRGALANVANVGQVAVAARALRDGQQSGGRPSRVVLAPRRWCQVCGKRFPRAMVANKPGTPGRARSNRKTIAQGMPFVSGGPCECACVFLLLHAWLRVRRASGIPCALTLSKAREFLAKLRRVASREGRLLPRHCEPTGRANARPMTGSAKQSRPSAWQELDCFAALAMTGLVV